MKDLRNIAKHFIRKKLFVGTISFIVANIIPVFIFLILSTLLLAMIGALSGSVDNQQNRQKETGENGIGYVCSPTGDINQKAWDNYFKHEDKSGVFAEYGDDIIEIAEEKDIDPVLFGAIALHETAYGTSKGVIDKNNPGGLMNPSTNMQSLQRFSTLREGLEAMAATLYNRIIEDGLVTIEQLGEIYAPVGATNDPNNLNQHWIPTMKELTKKLGGLTMNCEAKSQVDADLMDGKSWIASHTKTITSGFGYRTGCGNCSSMHAGIDIASAGIKGTPIIAFADGEVTISEANGTTFNSTLKNMGNGYGWYVEINHGNGIKTRYAHMKKKGISVGKKVKAGEVIGQVGSTGASTNPHLHFEILIDDKKVDPLPYVKQFLVGESS
ncbi:peptidoglycan DD-metalloendopeptidase family protein [Virgibacillus sp. MSJ-26]|uniref:peptidoglycan DD-metalloendopeptidase family protein n=1 Tax=Virgibacillus sp. MSJ-26 TaxID=2841522 RepID=UPI001C10F23E|nr:peptidoglycan DD-metalloendopeptidase family protein [Virgibacillus sp. MSJ-26]